MTLKCLHINATDVQGGAARAAYRIHCCLLEAGVISGMGVDRRYTDDPTVQGPISLARRLSVVLRPRLGALFARSLVTQNSIIHSPALLSSRWPSRLNRSDAAVVNLHWLGAEMMSVADIARIRKPIVWTLHDMWAFCGAEHYSEDDRWRVGYRRDNRPAHESGFDLNRWVWNRKRRLWRIPMHIVTPSRWLADCVRESALMGEWPVTVVPNAIDVDTWTPIEQGLARELLRLPKDRPLLVFGAMGGGRDPRKGFDLLRKALPALKAELPELELVVFGQRAPREMVELGFPCHYTGHLHDDISLRLWYSAADVFVLPSRQDNLPNTALEAHACGTPMVAFDIGGLADIVSHRHTGYLAEPFDTEDLAAGIHWVLSDSERLAMLGRNARARAVERFAYPVVAAQYRSVYETAVREQGGDGG